MKIFISWSGTRSHKVALALRDWLPDLFNGIELFVSSEDIRRGKRWPIEVSKELDSSNFGIVCLTKENLEAPWILFESGALSKSLADASLFTLLVGGLKPSDVDGPLSHFQHSIFEKEHFFGLIKTIDDAHGVLKREEARLRKNFERSWSELEENVNKAVKTSPTSTPERPPEEMLREILDVVTSMAKNMPQLPGLLEEVKKYYGPSLITPGAKPFDMGFFWGDLIDTLRFSYPALCDALDGVGASYENGRINLFFQNESSLKAFQEKEYSAALFPLLLEKAKAHGARVGAMSVKVNTP